MTEPANNVAVDKNVQQDEINGTVSSQRGTTMPLQDFQAETKSGVGQKELVVKCTVPALFGKDGKDEDFEVVLNIPTDTDMNSQMIEQQYLEPGFAALRNKVAQALHDGSSKRRNVNPLADKPSTK